MNLPVVDTPRINAMSAYEIEKVRSLESSMLQLPQVDISTAHLIHAGMYSRTITIPAGVAITGAEILRATVLIFNGCATMFVGDGAFDLDGYHVIPCSAGRKQAFMAHKDTTLTMIFPTSAQSVEEAESEYTNEAALLSSHKEGASNVITITGE